MAQNTSPPFSNWVELDSFVAEAYKKPKPDGIGCGFSPGGDHRGRGSFSFEFGFNNTKVEYHLNSTSDEAGNTGLEKLIDIQNGKDHAKIESTAKEITFVAINQWKPDERVYRYSAEEGVRGERAEEKAEVLKWAQNALKNIDTYLSTKIPELKKLADDYIAGKLINIPFRTNEEILGGFNLTLPEQSTGRTS